MTKKLPSLKSLRVFESVARNQSFRKAADELCVTHSAVSHQIKLLEEELGVLLFHRKGRCISLTKDGFSLYPVVSDSFDNIAGAVEQIKASHDSRTLTIQTYVTFGTTWLIPRLNDFQKQYPHVRTRISISFVDVDFEKDDADVGIIMGQPVWSHWEYDYLCDMDIFPVCSPQLLKSGRLNSPQDLSRHSLIDVELAADDWPDWLQAAGVAPEECKRGPVVDNYLQAQQSVYDGEGLAIARRAFVERDLAEGRLVQPFDIRVPERGSWYMVYPKERSVKKEVLLFREWLQQQIRQMPGIRITPPCPEP